MNMKKVPLAVSVSVLLLCRVSSGSDVVINEFMARNQSALTNALGETSDWIELHNATWHGVPVDMTGWYLTDDPLLLTKWAFPTSSIPGGGYLLVFADGSETALVSGELHASFSLRGDGEYLALVGPDGSTIVDEFRSHEYAPGAFGYPPQVQDVSYGRNATNGLSYFDPSTPGAVNAGGAEDFVADTKFNFDRGFYTNAFELVIACATPGAEIYYTTSGRAPDTGSTRYTGPIPISQTTCVRARAYKTGLYPSDVDTQTYIFPADVIGQSAAAPGPDWPAPGVSVNTQVIDYEMDPDVVGDPRYTNMMLEALVAIPTISIVTDLDNLFDAGIGIYVNSRSEGDLWERRVSAELIYPDDREGFQEDAGLRIRGGASRNPAVPKHGFRLRFRSAYGASKLRFNIFGDAGPDASNGVDLRCSQTPGWHYFSGRSVFARDIFARDLQIAQGQPSTRGDKYHLYLNGVYWGLYETQENIEPSFMAENWGGDEEDYDIISKKKHGYALDGSDAAYRDLWEITMEGFTGGAGMSNYFRAQGLDVDGLTPDPSHPKLLDAVSLADYMLVHYWTGELDGMAGRWGLNNYICAFNRKDPDGFKYFKYDSEWSLDVGFANNVSRTDTRTDFNRFNALIMHGRLVQNEEYLIAFADQTYKHFFNDGVMTSSNAVALFSKRTDEIDAAIVAESARWGDAKTPDDPKTKDDDWIPDVNTTVDWIRNRTATVIAQLRAAGWYPTLDPPVFSRHGGTFAHGFELSMTGSGAIYYTTDGSDPRRPVTGQVVGTRYENPIALSEVTHVQARAQSASGEWSALAEAYFVPDTPSPIRVSEVMYHPRDPAGAEAGTGRTDTAFEFIELYNSGPVAAGLAGARLTGALVFDFEAAGVTWLGPGEHIVVVKDLEAFKTRYPDWPAMNIAGEYQRLFAFPQGSLDNGGERVALVDAMGSEVLSFTYNDARDWPIQADGAGHSLVPLVFSDQSDGVLNYGGNWRASAFIDGSPGAADPEPIRDLLINELLAHTDLSDPNHPDRDSNDAIELYNLTGSEVTLTNWYLSDTIDDLAKWGIPGTNVIDALNWAWFDEVTGFHNPVTRGFGLDKAGEQVFLSHLPGGGADRVADAVRFKGQANGEAWGRYPDGETHWHTLAPTTNAANAAPGAHVLISEIMYHPAPTTLHPENNTNDEYVEIYNPLGVAVPLWTAAGAWRIDGGVTYTFPSNTMLAARGFLVLVSFDPRTDTTALHAFLDAHSLTNGQVMLLGPYKGQLDNRTERVAIERPQEPDMAGRPVSWIIVDEVVYFDRPPWPSGTDGTGSPLQRSIGAGAGNDPDTWFNGFVGTPGTPGTKLALSAPEHGARYFAPASVELIAAVDPEQVSNAVEKVEFFEGANSLCGVTQAPYTCSLHMSSVGAYTLTAVLTDGEGTTTSRQVVVWSLGVTASGGRNVTEGSADLPGRLLGGAPADVTVYWGTSDGGTNPGNWENSRPVGAVSNGTFAVHVDGLNLGRDYVYRCRAEADGKEGWSDASPFKTVSFDDWGYRVRIDLPGYDHAETLTNFPALIKLGPHIGAFEYGQFGAAGGHDLRFADAAKQRALPYEIDEWDTSGTSAVWVRIPVLGNNTHLWAYWGNPAVTSPPALSLNGAAWSEGYEAVWHLQGGLTDSAGQGRTAMNNGATATGGVVGAGHRFDGVDDTVAPDLPAAWYGVNNQALTVTMWASPSAVQASTLWGAQGAGGTMLHVRLSAGRFCLWRVGVEDDDQAVGDADVGQWQMVSMVLDGGACYGSLNDDAFDLVGSYEAFSPSNAPVIGWMNGDANEGYFDGLVDEIRISRRARSGAWIRAEYRTVADHDTFTTYGVVETLGAGTDLDGDGMADAWEIGNFGSTNAMPGGHGDWDRASNLAEYLAGTDPTNAASYFILRTAWSNGRSTVFFPAIRAAGDGYEGMARYYDLEMRASLSSGEWLPVPGLTNILGQDRIVVHTNDPAWPTRVFRGRVRLGR